MEFCQRLVLTVAVLTLTLSVAKGYPAFQTKIPNGDRVPHPCIPGDIWQGVGHNDRGGAGARNAFGLAFAANGKVWDRTLCEADSDGDGMSNGEELGDPLCQWTEGSAMTLRTTGLSHPGVCTPFDSDTCRGRSDFVTCETLPCAALNQPDTITHTVSVPATPVPEEATTYKCMPFEFPLDDEYHMIAFKPKTINWNLMDYVMIYGCTDDFGKENINQTFSCLMGDIPGCATLLGTWKLGGHGYCLNDVAGIRVGLGGFKRAFLEMHWNNPGQGFTIPDKLGFDFFLTKTLRPNDAAVMAIGQTRLNIPPREESYLAQGTCSTKCTGQFMTGDINIMSVHNHMHFSGHKGVSKLRVPGEHVTYLAYDTNYDNNGPVSHIIDPPMAVRPGEELEMNCMFNTLDRNTTTVFGIGTYDEMCFAFILFYPAQNVLNTQCSSNGIFEACEPVGTLPIANGCNFGEVLNENLTEVMDRYTKIAERCSISICRKECKEYVKELYEHPCYNEVNRPYLKEINFASPGATPDDRISVREHWSRIESCNMEIARESVVVMPPVEPTDAASCLIVNGIVVTCLLIVAMLFK